MKYIFGFLCLFIVFFIIYIIKNKVKIKWFTFRSKGFRPDINQFGVYCYCGKQGSGKTYSVISYLYENKDKIIYANLKSIDQNKIPYIYIEDLKQMLTLRSEHDIVIFFDEIFTEISKLLKTDNKLAKDILDFLSQMRKRRIILLTTCQEWRLLPLYFRLYCRYQINCRMIRIPFFKGIVIKNFIDGDNIKWDETEQDFVGDLIQNVVEHTRVLVGELYDTFEQIGEYSNYSEVPVSNGVTSEELDVAIKNSDQEFWNDLEVSDLLVNGQVERDAVGQPLTKRKKKIKSV